MHANGKTMQMNEVGSGLFPQAFALRFIKLIPLMKKQEALYNKKTAMRKRYEKADEAKSVALRAAEREMDRAIAVANRAITAAQDAYRKKEHTLNAGMTKLQQEYDSLSEQVEAGRTGSPEPAMPTGTNDMTRGMTSLGQYRVGCQRFNADDAKKIVAAVQKMKGGHNANKPTKTSKRR